MVSDPFLSVPKKKRSRASREDEEIDSDAFDSDNETSNKKGNNRYEEDDEEDSEDDRKNESKTEKRRRLAKQYLQSLKHEDEIKESNYDDETTHEALTDFTFDAKDLDNDNISRRLQLDSIELKGNIYKFIGDQLRFAKKKCDFLNTNSYLLNPTSLAISYPNLYVVSKKMQLIKYDVSKSLPKKLKYVNMKVGLPESHSDEITCVATNGKFVVTGSKDQSISIWDSTNLTFLKNIPLKNKKASINSMVFRSPGSNELYVASSDLKIRIYNVMQFALIDTLYGHQDAIIDISSIGNAETAVTVGFRDKSAMFWKIPQQTRLTFNSNVSFEKFYNQYKKNNLGKELRETLQKKFVGEGSLDCVSMLDNTHFVTGSDNGNISFWTTQKKKPIFIHYQAHGYVPQLEASEYTGDEDYIDEIDKDKTLASSLLPPQQPYPITKVASIPYSNVFVTGSYDSNIKIWQLDANLRGFHLVYELRDIKGIITDIEVSEIIEDKVKYMIVLATVSKEHKLGRWLKKPIGAKNGIFKAKIKINKSN